MRHQVCVDAFVDHRPSVRFQLADTKHLISFALESLRKNLPTWADWRTVVESELARDLCARDREERYPFGRAVEIRNGSVGPWNRSARCVPRYAMMPQLWALRPFTTSERPDQHGPTEPLRRFGLEEAGIDDRGSNLGCRTRPAYSRVSRRHGSTERIRARGQERRRSHKARWPGCSRRNQRRHDHDETECQGREYQAEAADQPPCPARPRRDRPASHHRCPCP